MKPEFKVLKFVTPPEPSLCEMSEEQYEFICKVAETSAKEFSEMLNEPTERLGVK